MFSLPFCFVIIVLDFAVAVVRALNIFWMVLCVNWLNCWHYDYCHLSPKRLINCLKQHALAAYQTSSRDAGEMPDARENPAIRAKDGVSVSWFISLLCSNTNKNVIYCCYRRFTSTLSRFVTPEPP